MAELYAHQRMCRKLTNHKYRKCFAYSTEVVPNEYYYTCQVCGYTFWNEHPPKKLPGGSRRAKKYES